MSNREISLFRGLFVAAAIWNLAGGILGYFNTDYTFTLLFDRTLTDPLYHDIYRGACGTTLLYAIGYSVVAYNPTRHTGIVLVGGLGKIGFAIQLLKFYLAGMANSNVFVVVIGDFTFVLSFLYYYFRLLRTKHSLLGDQLPRAPPAPSCSEPNVARSNATQAESPQSSAPCG